METGTATKNCPGVLEVGGYVRYPVNLLAQCDVRVRGSYVKSANFSDLRSTLVTHRSSINKL